MAGLSSSSGTQETVRKNVCVDDHYIGVLETETACIARSLILRD
jgi:hypothetical protein